MRGRFGFNLFRVTAAMEGLATLIRSQICFQFYFRVNPFYDVMRPM